jgi:hypothetical protein
MILYLHGFRSSPQSKKALILKAALEQRGLGAEFACPQLPASPRAAAELIAATAALDAPGRTLLAVDGGRGSQDFLPQTRQRLHPRLAAREPRRKTDGQIKREQIDKQRIHLVDVFDVKNVPNVDRRAVLINPRQGE